MKHVMVQFIKALMVMFILGNITAVLALPHAAMAAERVGKTGEEGEVTAPRERIDPQTALAIAIGVGVSCVAAGFAVGRVGSAAIGAVSERPEMFGRSLVFVGLAEGIAIYGLIIGIMLMRA
jgi:V/A-type H+-transporting ATPase subunit K